MNKLNREQQQFILDFYFRCGEPDEINRGRDLIASNPEAAKLYADLETTLTDLDHFKYDACPENLVDLTVARLKLLAKSNESSNSHLQQLLENEQNALTESTSEPAYKPNNDFKPPSRGSLRPVFEILAAAASIAIIAAILFPGINVFRAHSQQVSCQRNLSSIGTGFASFSQDNHDRLSKARVKEGDPWWKIGYQGKENQSNTRYPFMLVKQGYVDAESFVCKASKQASALKYEPSTMSHMNDFPSRNNITYSFSLFCDKNSKPLNSKRKIIAGDLNPVFVPVFERIPCDPGFFEKMNEFEKVLLTDQLKQILSMNHRGRGQNVLYCDGSVEFVRERMVNGDDIFTVNGVDAYTGREMPLVENDVFLAP